MRLFHFCHTYITQTETFLFRFVERSRTDADVSVFALNLANLTQFYPQGTGSLRIVQLCPPRPRSIATALRYLWQKVAGSHWQRHLEAALRAEPPDLVHCHFGQMGVKFMRLLQETGLTAKYVVSFYGADASVAVLKDPDYARHLPRLWSSACGFLVEGPTLGKKLTELGAPPEKIQISPLIVPLKDFPVKKDLPELKNQLRFLLVGRFIEKKGFHIFFDCLGKAKDRLPPFTVTVIGDGDLKTDYLRTIRSYGYEERVRFLGFRPHTECLALMAQNDILVQPSVTARNGDSEGGAPTILIEAQAIGIPIVASTHADIPFVMGYSELQMVENQPETLTRILVGLPSRTDWEQLVQRGRQKVWAQHDAATAPSPYTRFLSPGETPCSPPDRRPAASGPCGNASC